MQHAPTSGPAVTFTGLIPDLHHYKGSFGRRAFPLWADAAGKQSNVQQAVLDKLGATYGVPLTAEDMMAYVAAVAAHPGGFVPTWVVFNPDGRTLASAAGDPGTSWRGWVRDQYNARVTPRLMIPPRCEVVLLDVATGAALARAPGAMYPEFSPDGRTLATQGQDGYFSLRPIPARP